jgi:hypothetical protein
MTATRGAIEDLIMRIQAEFLRNPSLALTLTGAQRQFGIDEVTCAAVLAALVDARVLTQREGTYLRHFPRLGASRAA